MAITFTLRGPRAMVLRDQVCSDLICAATLHHGFRWSDKNGDLLVTADDAAEPQAIAVFNKYKIEYTRAVSCPRAPRAEDTLAITFVLNEAAGEQLGPALIDALAYATTESGGRDKVRYFDEDGNRLKRSPEHWLGSISIVEALEPEVVAVFARYPMAAYTRTALCPSTRDTRAAGTT